MEHKDEPNSHRLFLMRRLLNCLPLVLKWVVHRGKLKGECALSLGLTDRIGKEIQNLNQQLEGKMRDDK